MTALTEQKAHSPKPEQKSPAEVAIEGVLGPDLSANLRALSNGLDIGLSTLTKKDPYAPLLPGANPVKIVMDGENADAFSALHSVINDNIEASPEALIAKTEEVIETILWATPVIQRRIEDLLKDQKGSSDKMASLLTDLNVRRSEIYGKDPGEMNPQTIEDFFRKLDGVASALTGPLFETIPTEQEVAETEALIGLEASTQGLDSILAGLKIKPDLAGAFDESDSKGQVDIIRQAQLVGDKDAGVLMRHRPKEVHQNSWRTIVELKQLFHETFHLGSETFAETLTATGELVDLTVVRELALLEEAGRLNETTLAQALTESPQDAETHVLNALVTEEYIAGLAGIVKSAANRRRLNLGREDRTKLSGLTEKPFAREIRKAAKRQPRVEEDPYKAITLDETVRDCVRTVRTVLHGGGKFEFPSAKEISRKLLTAQFKTKRTSFGLEIPESGLIMSVVCGKFEDFVSFRDRCLAYVNGQVDDVQVGKFKHDNPDQFQGIIGFDIKRATKKVLDLFGSVHWAEQIYKALPAQHCSTVKQVLQGYLEASDADPQTA